MRFLSNLKELTTKNITVLQALLLFFSLVLIAPFYILSYYNNPSIDDYSFVFNTSTQGFWKAQQTWYLTWTGRYFSLFILSAHPLLIGSFKLYKLISVLLLVLTTHSIYRLISITFYSADRIIRLLLSIIVSFCFLNGMPSLVQGIYWEPGAVTYQLANILTLYLAVNLIHLISTNAPSVSVNYKIINSVLIIAICGLNETSLLLVDFLLASFMAYDILQKKKIKREWFIYILLAIVCSLVVIMSPGNAIRDQDASDINKHHAIYTIISSFKTSYHSILHWLLSFQLIIPSFLVLAFYLMSFKKKTIVEKKKMYFIPLAIFGYLLIVISFTSGFWATGTLAPARTINISYWVFICIWVSALISFFNFISPVLGAIKNYNYYPVVFIFLFVLFLSIDKTGNYYIAVKDLVSGKAFTYNKECHDRDWIMKTSKETIVSIPSFSVFPTSIFNEDITGDEKNWWNYMYSHYYNRDGVRVVFKDPYYSRKYFFNFENEANQMLSNQNTITTEVCFSPPNSSVLSGQDSYSATFKRKIQDLGFDDISEITTAHTSVQFYAADTVINAVFVFCITDPVTNKDVFWKGKEITGANCPRNKWAKEECIITIGKEFLKPENVISVYTWNRSKSKLYIDDLLVSVY